MLRGGPEWTVIARVAQCAAALTHGGLKFAHRTKPTCGTLSLGVAAAVARHRVGGAWDAEMTRGADFAARFVCKCSAEVVVSS